MHQLLPGDHIGRRGFGVLVSRAEFVESRDFANCAGVNSFGNGGFSEYVFKVGVLGNEPLWGVLFK